MIKEAYIEGLGTVRVCIGCDCLVAGGPTRCGRCASATSDSENSAAVMRETLRDIIKIGVGEHDDYDHVTRLGKIVRLAEDVLEMERMARGEPDPCDGAE